MVSGRPRVRVGFALGSWQVVALAAGMAQADARGGPGAPCEDHIVLYETVPISGALQAAMRDVALAIRPWHSVVEAFELLASVHRRIGQGEFDALQKRLRHHLNIDRIDELWLCWLRRAPERLILDTFPTARVHLYEDGLFSYLPQQPAPVEPPPAVLPGVARWRATLANALDARRPVRRFRRYKGGLDPRHASRIDAAWMLLADLWPPPDALAHVPWHAVSPAVLRDTLRRCRTLPSVAAFVPDRLARPAILVVGQTLSRWQAMTRAEEQAVYVDAVATALDRGYDVLWKEHPRALEPFFPQLAAAFPRGRVRELALPFALPVELVSHRLNLAGCAAGISTALYYLPRLCNIAAFTFADALAPHLADRWALQNELVRHSVTPLSALPAAPTAAAVEMPVPPSPLP